MVARDDLSGAVPSHLGRGLVLPEHSGRVTCAQPPYLTQERLGQGRKNLLRLAVSENLSRKSRLGASESVGRKSVMLG
jgi:hypothetical protein